MNHTSPDVDLRAIAEQVVRARGFDPRFPPEVQQQISQIQQHPPSVAAGGDIRDLRNLLWSSIDNDDSRDLDQIEVAERVSATQTKVLVAIADVAAFVPKKSPIDSHAGREATTVYTGVRVFPMLPEQLSTGITSLLEGSDKLCVVTEFVVDKDGLIQSSNVYRAVARNKAQLTYSAVGAWLEGRSAADNKVASSPELQALNKFDIPDAQDMLQFRAAFRPLVDQLQSRVRELIGVTSTDSQSFLVVLHNTLHQDRWTRPHEAAPAVRLAHWLLGTAMLVLTISRGVQAARHVRDAGLLEPVAWEHGRAVLTLRGRLLADAVVRELVD